MLGPSAPFKELLRIFPISSISALHFPFIFIKPILSKILISCPCNWIPLFPPQYPLQNRPSLKGKTFNVLAYMLILRLFEITLKEYHQLYGIP